ncbi:MAG: hypothetical protein H6937_02085 [Burkholderiales bacterium]|nr:hypothetical protein [Burkholderiales bacterium]MDR4517945.1 hypothetical protein [Nitrosomonas sp.]
MKTGTAQTLTIISLVASLLLALPATTFAGDQDTAFNTQSNANHSALAQYYKEQADEYKAKIEEEIEAIKNKPSTASFGRNAKTFKQHVDFKLRQFEAGVEENLNKAAYHEKMAAEQSFHPASVPSGKTKS